LKEEERKGKRRVNEEVERREGNKYVGKESKMR
jgi:hypothetical protein